ncbi:MAG: thioredoxin-dependent thiol peroxidase [Crocinitomicaceae bacterium]|nr:thioredoxin-dependent thiol peroxidase [Flavobacteriales bacterium]NQZ36267.1 thioredoxin-dependent thiol peroxidase [Crocinitomicaceae bacterium]
MKHLKLAQPAPTFTAKNQNGSDISLTDFSGKPVVIYFYPKDNTPGCTTQACNLRDNYSSLLAEDIVVIGVSADDEIAHQKFIKKFDLPFPLIADVNKELIELYGVWGEKKFMGKIYDGIHRTTFVLDKSHTIIGIIEKPKNKDHAREVLEIFEKNKTS